MLCVAIIWYRKLAAKRKRILQAHVRKTNKYCKDRASRTASFCHHISEDKGSATLEAAMILPVFLAAAASLITIGQMLMISSEIQSALTQTAKIYAQSISTETSGSKDFFYFLDADALCSSCIAGGRNGITIRQAREEGDICKVSASYVLKAPLPFFSGIRIPQKLSGRARIFSGYIPGISEEEEDRVVYIAEHGSVYHLRADCSHICLTIRDAQTIRGLIDSGRYLPCEKCIHGSERPSVIYVTAYGDCFHSSLSCSGLKRTVKAVSMKEVKGMRRCSRCGR